MSISTGLPRATVKAQTVRSWPPSIRMSPAAPLTSAGRSRPVEGVRAPPNAARATASGGARNHPGELGVRRVAKGTRDHVGIEQGDERLQVATAGRASDGQPRPVLAIADYG